MDSKTTGPKPRHNLFGYLDETGLLHTPATDKVFGLGLLVAQNPRELHRAIINFKNQRRYSKEFKFTDINPRNLGLYKDFINIFFSCHNLRFVCVVYDKKLLDIGKYFQGDHERAYSVFAAGLISKALKLSNSLATEYIAILADDVSTSKGDKFEKIIRDKTKMHLRRNALFGIARLESHAVSELQMCDVVLGTIAYAYKIKFGLVKGSSAKIQMVKYLQKQLGVAKVSEGLEKRLRKGIYVSVEEFRPNKK